MTTQTTDQGLTLPSGSDARNVVTAFSNLVIGTAAIESRLVKRYLSATDRATRNPTPATGELSWNSATGRYEGWNGSAWKPVNLTGTSRVQTRRATTQNVVTTTFTDVQWNTTDPFDSNNMHDTVTNPHLITLDATGLWLVTYDITFSGGNTSNARASFVVWSADASTRYGYREVNASSSGTVAIGGHMLMLGSLNDTVKLTVWQNSGATIPVAGNSGDNLTAVLLAPL